jgi:hypothetical protein
MKIVLNGGVATFEQARFVPFILSPFLFPPLFFL